MRTLVFLFVLAAPLAPAAQPVVLADGREQDAGPDVADWIARPAVIQAMDAARSHWRAADPSFEEEARVMSVADGGFTESGARRYAVLYLMSLWPRCCPRMGVALIEGDRLVGNWGFEGVAHTLDGVGDIDGDGMDEIVFTGEFGMGGQVSRSMTLAAFGADGLEDIGSTSIFESSCAAGPAGASSTAALVTWDGDAFEVERFTHSCEGGRWESAGAAAPFTLDPVGETRYVSLGAGEAPAAVAVRVERGRLQAGDQTLNSGEYVDEYEVACRRGRPLVVDLRSTEMDPYLIVRPPGGTQIDNDDHQGDRTHSRVEATPSVDGTCSVLVTTYQPGETGNYELSIVHAE
jgi:hypothetical protein